VVYLGLTFSNYQRSGAEYDRIRDSIFATEGEADVSQIQENLANLRLHNADVAAWIAFDNISISYPIMHGNDNVFYLNHTFSGARNPSGSIFLDALNTSDFSDAHTIVYGHNMRNGSMFGQLRNFRDREFAEENRYFTIYTLNNVFRYEIFSFYEITEFGDVYAIGFGHDEVFAVFVGNMLRRSNHNFQVSVSEEDKIVTLSTCSAVGMRFVVHGRQIKENPQ
jgi:sortase B